MKTCPGNCTPHKDRDILVAIDEFLMCAFEIRFESLYGKTKITQCSREKASLVHFVIFVFAYKDSNLISKLHT